MDGRVLPDTNIVIALFAGDPFVHEQISKANEVFLPAVVFGELFYGAFNSTAFEQNLSRIQELANESALLPCDSTTARHYGQIKNQLRSKGKPIPENDIWIAAIAQQYSPTLISRDDHFKAIDNMVISSW